MEAAREGGEPLPERQDHGAKLPHRRQASALGERRRRERELRLNQTADERRLDQRRPPSHLTIPLLIRGYHNHTRPGQRYFVGMAVVFKDINSQEQIGVIKQIKDNTCKVVWFYRKTLLQKVCDEGDLSNRGKFANFVAQLKDHQCLQSMYTDEVPLEDIVEEAYIHFPQFQCPVPDKGPCLKRRLSATERIESFRQQYNVKRDGQFFLAIGWLMFDHSNKKNSIQWGGFRSCTAHEILIENRSFSSMSIWCSIEREMFTWLAYRASLGYPSFVRKRGFDFKNVDVAKILNTLPLHFQRRIQCKKIDSKHYGWIIPEVVARDEHFRRRFLAIPTAEEPLEIPESAVGIYIIPPLNFVVKRETIFIQVCAFVFYSNPISLKWTFR